MSTIDILLKAGRLERIDGSLSANQSAERVLYGLKSVRTEYSTIRSMEGQDDKWVQKQVYTFVNSYVAGYEFPYDKPIPSVKYLRDGIWEFKTETLRFFGWFPAKNVFVLGKLVPKIAVTRFKHYQPYIDECIKHRSDLGFTEIKYIQSENVNDVF